MVQRFDGNRAEGAPDAEFGCGESSAWNERISPSIALTL